MPPQCGSCIATPGVVAWRSHDGGVVKEQSLRRLCRQLPLHKGAYLIPSFPFAGAAQQTRGWCRNAVVTEGLFS